MAPSEPAPTARPYHPSTRLRRSASPAMRWIGLAALSAVFGAERAAHAQAVDIGPGNFTTGIRVHGQDAVVHGQTTIDVPPNAVFGVGLDVAGGAVLLDSTTGPIAVFTRSERGYGLLAMQAGTSVTSSGSDLRITTSGVGAAGVAAFDQASISLDGVQIRTLGGPTIGLIGAYGAQAGAGASVALARGSIVTEGGSGGVYTAGGSVRLTDVDVEVRSDPGDRGNGVNAQWGGQIEMVGGSVLTEGDFGNGIRASGLAAPGSTVTATDVAVRTGGANAHGALSMSGAARIALASSAIETGGTEAAGLYAIHTGSIDVVDSNIRTVGDSSYGAYARAGSRIDLTRTEIQTMGAIAAGVRAGDAGSVLTATDALIDTRGWDAVGASVFGGASMSLTRTTIDTRGFTAHGVAANGAGSSVALDTVTVTTRQYASHALAAWAGGAISGSGVTATTNADQASALFLNGVIPRPSDPSASSAVLTGNSRLTSTTAPTIAVAGGTGTVSMEDTTVHGDNLWLRVARGDMFHMDTRRRLGQPPAEGVPEPLANENATEVGRRMTSTTWGVNTYQAPGLGEITASRSSIRGAAQTDEGSVSDVRLLQGTVWDMTGNSNLTRLTVDSSQVRFAPPSSGAFKTLTVRDYHGDGGVLRLNTVLGGDGSASDRLVVTGSATGQSRLQIVNAGGAGALTQANGVQVVEAANGATTAAGAFALDGRVVAGAYEYRLFRGSADGSAPQSWFLRSQLPTPPDPQPPEPQPPEPQPPQPEPPQPQPPGPSPQPPRPLYRPEVGAYLANQRVVGQMFVHSLHDRMGEPQFLEGQRGTDSGGAADAIARTAWLRGVGSWEGSRSRDRTFDVDTDTYIAQGGFEVAQWSVFAGADRLHLGVMGAYVRATSDGSAQGNAARARGEVEGFLGGLHATWYQNDENRLGLYSDTWFQYGRFDNRVEGAGLPTVKYDSHGVAVSQELGYAVPLPGRWVVEPQAQLMYVDQRARDITETNGTRVSGADSDGVITRLGVRLHRTVRQDQVRRVQPYLTLNWWHGDTGESMRFDQVPLGGLYPSNRYEVKLGVNARFDRRWAAWANVAGAWGRQDYDQYTVRVGLKYMW